MKNRIFTFFLLLSFSVSGKAQEAIDSTQVYLRNAKILDFQSKEFRLGNVLIQDGIISQIDFGYSSADKAGILNYNLENKYLIPGLIDAHVHVGTDPSGADNLEDTKKRLQYLLNNGITTVRDMAGDARYLNYLARQASLDEFPSPDIYFSALFAGETFLKDPRTQAAAQGAEPGNAPWMRAILPSSDVDRMVAEAKGTGASGIKIYADLDEQEVSRITKAAHQQNLKVWAHATVFPARPSEVAQAKVDVMSHASYLAWEGENEIPADATARKRKHEHFDPSNPVFLDLLKSMSGNKTILDATVTVYRAYFPDSALYGYGISLTRLAYQNGVPIGVGTDIYIEDFDAPAPLFEEMEALQNEVGMSPIDILLGATLVNANMIGAAHQIGSIEVGKKANLLVLQADPLLDIKNCRTIEFILKNGKGYPKN